MNVLQQYNLTSRPVVNRRAAAAAAAKEGVGVGVVVRFSRKLPSEILKKPASAGLSGYAAMRSEREEEFKPELPVEGEAAAETKPQRRPVKPESSVFVDERHIANIDRSALLAKIRGSTFSFPRGDEGGRIREMEVDIGEDLSK